MEKAKAWVNELQRQADPNIVIALAGNKCDLDSRRAVETEVCYDCDRTFTLKRNVILMLIESYRLLRSMPTKPDYFSSKHLPNQPIMSRNYSPP